MRASPQGPPRGPPPQRRVLIIGGGIGGLAAARELRKHFRVTLVDAKEYFEFTSGILRAYVRPSHWDSITFHYKEVLERIFGVAFIWGEVKAIEGAQRFARIKPMFASEDDVVAFDFCIIAAGCSFNQHSKWGESPWFPTIHEDARAENGTSKVDERFQEGRRRRILEENRMLSRLNRDKATALIVGAGFKGVEWACELAHYFPELRIILTDWLPRCLAPLSTDAATYCEEYMRNAGIDTFYQVKYEPSSERFWSKLRLAGPADVTYFCDSIKHSNYFMPQQVLSQTGPGGGGWVIHNQQLQVVTRNEALWGAGAIFAVGDCILGSVGRQQDKYILEPAPKTAYPAEQQALHASRNVMALDWHWHGQEFRKCPPVGPGCLNPCFPRKPMPTWYPWGAGIFAVSLGPSDGCIITGGTHEGSQQMNMGRLAFVGLAAAVQKELIETTKVAQGRGSHSMASLIWYTIHHWPVNLWGKGRLLT